MTAEEHLGALLDGKYHLGGVVGRGGMATVFEARHIGTGRRVAVKMLNPEYEGDAEASDRFLREARVAADLKHPNVVDVLDLGDAHQVAYMVLEFLDGESLARTLQRDRPLPFERASALLVPVMRAMAYVHARNVVHRDLKPENLFIHRDEAGDTVPKVLDFGIARFLDADHGPHITQAGMVMGTPAYMSPEQARGISDEIGTAADVWSMGIIWYEALTGTLPFVGPTPVSTLLAVSQHQHVPFAVRLPTLPGPVAEVLERSLARLASARYADMGAFLVALERAVARVGDTRSAGLRVSSVARVGLRPWLARDFEEDLRAIKRRPRRSGRLLSGLTLAAAVLVGAAVALWAGRHRGAAVSPPAPIASAEVHVRRERPVTQSAMFTPSAPPVASPAMSPVSLSWSVPPSAAPQSTESPRGRRRPSPRRSVPR